MKNKLHNILESSECISRDMLIKYHNNQLSNKERHIIERHLLNCEMCSDELEGIALSNSEKSSEIILEINKTILKKSNDNYAWIKVAASIAIILVSGTLIYLLNQYDNNDGLAENKSFPVTDSVIIEETIVTVTDSIIDKNIIKDNLIKDEELEIIKEEPSANVVKEYKNLEIELNGGTSTFEWNKSEVTSVVENENQKDLIDWEESEKENEELKKEKDSRKDLIVIFDEKEEEVEEIEFILSESIKINEKPDNKANKRKREESKSKTLAFKSKEPEPVKSPSISNNYDYYKDGIISDSTDDASSETLGYISYDKELSTDTTMSLKSAKDIQTKPNIDIAIEKFNNKEYRFALIIFDKIITDNKGDFNYYKAKYYKALCYLELNKKDDAIKLLKEIASENNTFSEKAKKKLTEIK